MNNDEFHPTIELIAASIVDELYPMIVKSVAKALDQEFDYKKLLEQKKSIQVPNFKTRETKHADTLRLVMKSFQEQGIFTPSLVQLRTEFYKTFENSVSFDTRRQAFKRAFQVLQKEQVGGQ